MVFTSQEKMCFLSRSVENIYKVYTYAYLSIYLHLEQLFVLNWLLMSYIDMIYTCGNVKYGTLKLESLQWQEDVDLEVHTKYKKKSGGFRS